MFEVFIFCMGLSIGSFLNVCIYRLPLNKSIVTPSSYCTVCNNSLKPFDMIPILSYIFLKGKCRFCNTTFSVRYLFVELLTGLLFLWCLQLYGLSAVFFKIIVFVSFLVVITFIDLDYQLILDKVLIWFASLGLIINIILQHSFMDMLLGLVLGGGLLLLIAVITRGGMGGGDIKFAAVLGLWLGWQLNLLCLLLSFILGGAIGGLLVLTGVKQRRDFIPFGPFIAVGALIAVLYGVDIIGWYILTL